MGHDHDCVLYPLLLQVKRSDREQVEDEIFELLIKKKVEKEMEKAKRKCEREHRRMRKIMANWAGLGRLMGCGCSMGEVFMTVVMTCGVLQVLKNASCCGLIGPKKIKGGG